MAKQLASCEKASLGGILGATMILAKWYGQKIVSQANRYDDSTSSRRRLARYFEGKVIFILASACGLGAPRRL